MIEFVSEPASLTKSVKKTFAANLALSCRPISGLYRVVQSAASTELSNQQLPLSDYFL